ncbi:unnamed protein product [Dibothriocephalus latus]|uniref:F5/8 type C domain-containing protein n=1 Tax=Dibothriocephalus latus TaxID=60516 RepID=A0A3P7L9V4_DIBLA|nr:unnamed protein product [Dibothriocephalus latus]
MQPFFLFLSIANLLLGLLQWASAAAPTTAEVLSSYQQPECDEPLLRESALPDSAFSATSNSEAMDQPAGEPSADHSAKAARNLVDGGWCPAGKVGRDFSEYIQIDMGTLNVIVKIAFGGRSGVGLQCDKKIGSGIRIGCTFFREPGIATDSDMLLQTVVHMASKQTNVPKSRKYSANLTQVNFPTIIIKVGADRRPHLKTSGSVHAVTP